MFLRTVCIIFVAGSLALAATAPAEIVGFPEKNPVFTVEVPKDAKVKFEGDQLRIFPAKHQGDVSSVPFPMRSTTTRRRASGWPRSCRTTR